MGVKSWGSGKPDYYKSTLPGRPIVAEPDVAQKHWVLNQALTVSAGAVTAVEFYTVPGGWKMTLGGGFISCSASCIQNVRIVHTPGIIGDFRYDMRGDLIFTELSGQLCDPGDVLTVYVFNNDSVARDFSVTLTGVLEKVKG